MSTQYFIDDSSKFMDYSNKLTTSSISTAISVIKSGGLVVIPTDTVYGIGSDAFDMHAIKSLLKTKACKFNRPIGILVGSWNTINGLAHIITYETKELIHAFWPGPLSIIVKQAPSFQRKFTDSNGNIMLRMPLHPIAIELLQEVGPMAVSSANTSGNPPATSIKEAQSYFGNKVSVYLDGGNFYQQNPSTIIDMTKKNPCILRNGPININAIAEVLCTDPSNIFQKF